MALSEGVSRKTGSVMRAGDGATHGTSTAPVKASGMGVASPRALGGSRGRQRRIRSSGKLTNVLERATD
jgi:hypothetical protein